MSRLPDTSTTLEDESTFSENVVASEKDIVVSANMATDEKTVNTSNVEFAEDTNFEPSEDKTWKEQQKPDPQPPKIRVFDIAAYILEKMEPMTTMKLQKLVYYSQAWSLVWDEKPLFEENIEAWANGPVVRELFDYHRGWYEISSMPIGNSRLLNQEQHDTVDAVLEYYGDKSSQWLIELTHMEDPWVQARKGLDKLERGNRVISLDAMADYYSSLSVEDDYEDEE
jgi:uncharacterized phage-associated protein